MKMRRWGSVVGMGILTAIMGLGVQAADAPAKVVWSENFDALTPGPIAGQKSNGLEWTGSKQEGRVDEVQSAVAKSGNALALRGGEGTSYIAGIFQSAETAPVQLLEFDLRMDKTIADFAGQKQVDLQSLVMVRGPKVNEQIFLVYKAFNNADGAVSQDRFEVRVGGGSNESSPAPEKNVWYHVAMLFDFTKNRVAVKFTKDNAVWWEVQPQPLAENGNTNGFGGGVFPSTVWHIDNMSVSIPAPAAK